MESAYSQCAQVIARFYCGLDASNLTMLLACVDADSVWVRKGERLIGPDQIRHAVQARDPARVTAHLVNNLVVESTNTDTVVANYYLTVFDNLSPLGGMQAKAVLRSTDTYTLRDGAWWLVEKRSSKQL